MEKIQSAQADRQAMEEAKKTAEAVRMKLYRLNSRKQKNYTYYSVVRNSAHSAYFVPCPREREPFREPKTNNGSVYEREYLFYKTLAQRRRAESERIQCEAPFEPKLSEFARQFVPRQSQAELDADILARRIERVANDVPRTSMVNVNYRPLSDRMYQSVVEKAQKLRDSKIEQIEKLDQNCTFYPRISKRAREMPARFEQRLYEDTYKYRNARMCEIEREKQQKLRIDSDPAVYAENSSLTHATDYDTRQANQYMPERSQPSVDDLLASVRYLQHIEAECRRDAR